MLLEVGYTACGPVPPKAYTTSKEKCLECSFQEDAGLTNLIGQCYIIL